jgi:hypothetical protein
MLFRIATKDFEELGLNLAGFEDRQNCAMNNRRRFRCMYGVLPAAIAETFVDIQKQATFRKVELTVLIQSSS